MSGLAYEGWISSVPSAIIRARYEVSWRGASTSMDGVGWLVSRMAGRAALLRNNWNSGAYPHSLISMHFSRKAPLNCHAAPIRVGGTGAWPRLRRGAGRESMRGKGGVHASRLEKVKERRTHPRPHSRCPHPVAASFVSIGPRRRWLPHHAPSRPFSGETVAHGRWQRGEGRFGGGAGGVGGWSEVFVTQLEASNFWLQGRGREGRETGVLGVEDEVKR